MCQLILGNGKQARLIFVKQQLIASFFDGGCHDDSYRTVCKAPPGFKRLI
jgi:hypothetical protein